MQATELEHTVFRCNMMWRFLLSPSHIHTNSFHLLVMHTQ